MSDSSETLKLILDLQIQSMGQQVLDSVAQSFEGLAAKAGELNPLLGGLAVGAEAMLTGVAAVGVGLGVATKAAADWQTTMAQTANNTNMTNQQMAEMNTALLRMAQTTSAPLDQLAEGYMHIANMGFQGADATAVLTAAMESAISTGGDVGATANVLANVMHEFAMSGSQAGQAMDELHTAAALGNMTLEQMVNSFGPVAAIASTVGVSLDQASSAMATLTKHGFDAAESGTQLKNFIEKLAAPTAGARKEIELLAKTTGVDLTADFSQAGLASKGLTGVLDDIARATGGNVQAFSQLLGGATLTTDQLNALAEASHGNLAALQKLDPNIRGLYAEFILSGRGAGDYLSILKQVDASTQGAGITSESYARTQATLNFQLGLLKNNLQVAAIEVGQHFLPLVTDLVGWVNTTGLPAFVAFAGVIGDRVVPVFQFAGTVIGNVMGIFRGADFGGILTSLGTLGTTIAGLFNMGGGGSSLTTAFGQLSTAASALGQGGLFAGFARGVEDATGPLLLALGNLLGSVGDWLLRTAVPFVVDHIAPWAGAFIDWVLPATDQLLRNFGQMLSNVGNYMGSTGLPFLSAQLAVWGSAFVGWIGPRLPAVLSELDNLVSSMLAWMGQTALPNIASKLRDWGLVFISWIDPQIPGILAGLGHLLGTVAGWIVTTGLPALVAAVARWGLAFIGWVAPQIPGILAQLGDLLGALATWAVDTALPAIVKHLADWGSAFVTWIVPWIPIALAALGGLLQQMVTWIAQTALPAIGTALLAWGHAFLDWIGLSVLPALDTALGAIWADMSAWMQATAVKILAQAVAWGKAMVDGLVAGVVGLADRLGPAINAEIAKIKVNAITIPIVGGAIQGVGAGFSGLGTAANAGVNAAQAGAKAVVAFGNDPNVQATFTGYFGAANAAVAWAEENAGQPLTVNPLGKGAGGPGGGGRSGDAAAAAAKSHFGDKDTWGSGHATQCETFVEEMEGWGNQGVSAIAAWDSLHARGYTKAGAGYNVGDTLYFGPDGSNGDNGHTGIVIGPDRMISVGVNGVEEDSISAWTSQKWIDNGWGAPLLGYVPAGSVKEDRFGKSVNRAASSGVSAPSGGQPASTLTPSTGSYVWDSSGSVRAHQQLMVAQSQAAQAAGNPPGSASDWVAQAMAIDSIPSGYLPALMRLVTAESSGQPWALNTNDSNWQAGYPSAGLMQTIPQTFQKYQVAGHGNIWNPVDNAAAAIEYMLGTYGSIDNVPGIASTASGGAYLPYATGGWITEAIAGIGLSTGQRYKFGEREAEMIVPRSHMQAGGSGGRGGDLVININNPTLLNSRDMDELATKLGRVLVRQAGTGYSLAGLGAR